MISMADVEGTPRPLRGKHEYVKPTLERLGTIRDLTHGIGKQGGFDNEHPPGQNKSVV
jgi:hypothetical protein